MSFEYIKLRGISNLKGELVMKKLKISFEEENKKEKLDRKYSKYPHIDQNLMAFGSNEEVKAAEIDYIRKIKSKVLKRFLLPTVIISVLLIAAVCCVSAYFYMNQSAEIEGLTLSISKKEQVIKTQKGRIEQLENSNAGNSPGQEFLINYLEEQTYASSNNNSVSSNNADIDKRLCTVPDCNSRANTGSYYCSRHECLKVDCHEPKANDLCMYCENHKCDMPGCNSGKSLNSYYCIRHS